MLHIHIGRVTCMYILTGFSCCVYRLTGLHAVCSLHICRVIYGYMLCVHFGNGYMQCALGYMFCIHYTQQWHTLCLFWHDYACLFTCWQGYMLMCKALAGEGNDILAASCLFKGMVHCNMTNDDTVNFIVQASQLLGKLKHDCPGRCQQSVAGNLVVDVGS